MGWHENSQWPDTLSVHDVAELRFVRVLGTGGFGDVALYSDTTVSYAVKETDIDESFVSDLLGGDNCGAIPLTRLEVAGGMVPIEGVHYCRQTPSHYYLMPAMDGTLEDLIEHLAPLRTQSPDLFAHVVTTVCNVVRRQIACMFERTGRPYLDLKPSNVLYRCDTGYVRLHVCDLGSLWTTDNKEYIATYPPPETSGSGLVPSTSPAKLQQYLSWVLGVLYASFVGPPMCPYTDQPALAFDQEGYVVERRQLPYYTGQVGPKIAYHKVTAHFGPEIGGLLHLVPSMRTSILAGDLDYTCPTAYDWKAHEGVLFATVVPDGWTLVRSRSDQDHTYFRTRQGESVTFVPQTGSR